LDLFCCAGGAGMGYSRAGFEVVGVDIEHQKNYPFEFHQADALEFLAEYGHEFDAIHASPPCQAYSMASATQRNEGKVYPDLLGPTRDALEALGKPYVIENVPGAPMRADYELCGCYFGLQLRRERWFETSWMPAARLYAHDHSGPPPLSVVGHGTPSWVREKLGFNPTIAMYRAAMGMDWTNRGELSQAIPPAYTELIGRDWMLELAVAA
jgi:DNA (cytosine-5)-methyltransferase 1